ncbi:hypothetical protein CXB51_028294 [Gossypium anomalum]|uniref:RNase H type-1 domain-containing protein n=1 Tax=Gossypium anomalum TaxID=47600 RepID=A0A8J6CKP8_9ROSI|nr:hypothetical protein CXB51_028294 [Gossypium anomalum]
MSTVDKLDNYLGLPLPPQKVLLKTFILKWDGCGGLIMTKLVGLEAYVSTGYSMFQGVKGKVFPGWDVFSYKKCDKPSFTWTRIAKAVDVIKDGLIWQSHFTNNERKVKDLWDHGYRRWKRERVFKIYGDNLGGCIYNFPIPHNGIKYTRTWIQNPHGIYTSRSAYSWMILKNVGFGPHGFFWRSIWKLKMLPKIKIFSWRIGHNILLTFDNIARICQGFTNICPRCQSKDETLILAMKDCPKAREILASGGFNNKLLEGVYTECINWLEDVFRKLDKKVAVDFLTLLWNSWNDRNNMVFKGKMDVAVMIWERAQTLSKDFRIFNLTEPPVIPLTQMNMGWKTLPTGYIKVNVVAAVSNGCSGFGVVARENDGFVLGGCYKFRNEAMDVNWAELKAFTEGLKLAEILNVTQLILESDSAVVTPQTRPRLYGQIWCVTSTKV